MLNDTILLYVYYGEWHDIWMFEINLRSRIILLLLYSSLKRMETTFINIVGLTKFYCACALSKILKFNTKDDAIGIFKARCDMMQQFLCQLFIKSRYYTQREMNTGYERFDLYVWILGVSVQTQKLITVRICCLRINVSFSVRICCIVWWLW